MPEEWRAKIQATQLLNRLSKCAMGEVEMTSAQIKAAEIILRKTVPDIARVEQQTLDKDGNPADSPTTKILIEHVSPK